MPANVSAGSVTEDGSSPAVFEDSEKAEKDSLLDRLADWIKGIFAEPAYGADGYSQDERTCAILTDEGELIIFLLPEDYEGIWALQRSNGRLYAARRASDHTSVVMDWHGNVLTGQGRALNPEISADGKYLRIYTGNGSYGIFKIA